MNSKIIGITIILLLIGTILPAGGQFLERNQEIIKNKDILNIDDPENFLGEILIVHKIIGCKVEFTPVGNNQRDFYFKEVDGKININFTIRGCHVLDKAAYNLGGLLGHKSHWEGWIIEKNSPEISYGYGYKELICDEWTQPSCEDFKIYSTNVELFTNNQSKKLDVLLYGAPIYILFPNLLNIEIPGLVRGAHWFLYDTSFWDIIHPGCRFEITVHPI